MQFIVAIHILNVTMCNLLIALGLINLLVNVNAISLKIDGTIELGPNWNIQYSVSPVANNGAKYTARAQKDESSIDSSSEEAKPMETKTTKRTTQIITKKKRKRKDTSVSFFWTDIDNPVNVDNNSNLHLGILKNFTATMKPKVYAERLIKGIYQTPHLVKEDPKVQDFIKRMRNNSEHFFHTMKSKMEDVRSKNKIDFLSRSYDEKFSQFLDETQDQKILTRLGTQKVILNLIDTSNGIMKRLVNYLLGDMQKKGTLRSGIISILEGQLLNEEKQDYLTACQKYKVCQTKDRFSLYAAEFLTEILSGNDDKIKLATGSFTEILKDADYSRFGGTKLKRQIEDVMDWIDEIEASQLRPLLVSFKNMLVSKNKPLVVMPDAYGIAMNKSVAFLDLVDVIDDKLPPTVTALKEWNESLDAIREWIAGLRTDSTDIMAKFASQFLIKAVDRMRGATVEKVAQNLKILFKPVESEEM